MTDPMAKDEFAEELRKRGYKAENVKGCVMVTSEKDVIRVIEQIAKEVGYVGSLGWRQEATET